jgi:hypothetical protein
LTSAVVPKSARIALFNCMRICSFVARCFDDLRQLATMKRESWSRGLMWRAWECTRRGPVRPGIDGVDLYQFALTVHWQLDPLRESWANGTYTPSPILVVGKYAYPTMEDRMMQWAFVLCHVRFDNNPESGVISICELVSCWPAALDLITQIHTNENGQRLEPKIRPGMPLMVLATSTDKRLQVRHETVAMTPQIG